MIARQNMSRWMVCSVLLLGLSACSHTPNASDIPSGANFSTKILADDTKLFTYTQRFMRGAPDMPGDADATIDNPKMMRERDGMREAISKSSRKGVEAMLAQNNYCRDGYMVLEQYEQHGSYIVRGECRDGATSADREKFNANK